MRNQKALHIVALGSSFASGPGIPPQAFKAAGRSEKNYAHLIASRLNSPLTDLSVSGATLLNVLSEPQLFFGRRFAPQLASLPPDVDIVTITAGGNDLGYIGGVIFDTLLAKLLARMLSHFLPAPVPPPDLSGQDVADRFVAVIDKIRETAPTCRVYLVEYLTLFGRHAKPGADGSLDEEKIEKYKKIAAKLQAAYKLAAKARSGCVLVPVGERSWDHGLGSEEPWVDGFSFAMWRKGKVPYHPNAKGMEAVAEMLYEELEKNEGISTDKSAAKL
jgi:lysophospholipase L1-like esterase